MAKSAIRALTAIHNANPCTNVTESVWPPRTPRAFASSKQRLLAALRELPEKQRRSVELRLFSEMTFAEVGAELGISEDAAKMNFHPAMKRLRTELDSGG